MARRISLADFSAPPTGYLLLRGSAIKHQGRSPEEPTDLIRPDPYAATKRPTEFRDHDPESLKASLVPQPPMAELVGKKYRSAHALRRFLTRGNGLSSITLPRNSILFVPHSSARPRLTLVTMNQMHGLSPCAQHLSRAGFFWRSKEFTGIACSSWGVALRASAMRGDPT